LPKRWAVSFASVAAATHCIPTFALLLLQSQGLDGANTVQCLDHDTGLGVFGIDEVFNTAAHRFHETEYDKGDQAGCA
jgi:hypothetical protein